MFNLTKTCVLKVGCDNAIVERSHIDDSLDEAEDNAIRYRKPLKIWRPMERINPEKRSRGFVFSAPTRAVYALWRRARRW
jgi:hypothetical protein